MMSPDSVVPLSSDLSERTLTINLILKDDQTVTVRSCEVLARGLRNRVSFQDKSTLDTIFVDKLAHAVRKCLATIPDGAHVLSVPEFLVELPGIALSGVHVLIMEVKDGMRNAIFRFKEFLGALNLAFLPDIGFMEPYTNHAEKLATNVLADICLPLLNMCRDLEYAQVDTRDHLPNGFADRAREFEFQTELLKRFIFNAGIGHAEPSQTYLEHEFRPRPLTLPGA
ncbi:hypothetical protein KX928_09900 [Roseobacter sp. YSTF-M11]|uniref:Uncharacterized protein n=1 Tax=Roseobacter insulae TaxID=2859783 RepID=A0A9X1FVZ6_9RHOB|nr:hypothetical protein [Roseobacter insulae]MBW4708100.1 hypothetical protein [Roseobacter insulae]